MTHATKEISKGGNGTGQKAAGFAKFKEDPQALFSLARFVVAREGIANGARGQATIERKRSTLVVETGHRSGVIEVFDKRGEVSARAVLNTSPVANAYPGLGETNRKAALNAFFAHVGKPNIIADVVSAVGGLIARANSKQGAAGHAFEGELSRHS